MTSAVVTGREMVGALGLIVLGLSGVLVPMAMSETRPPFWICQWIGSASILLGCLVVVRNARAATEESRQGKVQADAALAAVKSAGEEVQKTLQVRTAILGMTSHELRTPLSKILAATELLEIVAHGEGVAEATAELYSAAETMTHQLTDLASYAELAGAKPRPRTEQLDLRKCLAEIVRAAQSMTDEHRVTVEVDVAPEVPSTVRLDTLRVGQVAANLITNAVKYTRDGSVIVRARMSVAEGNALELVVQDTGRGIAPGEQALVWEPYYRSQSATEPGSGLGLAVVKLALDKLGGRVRLDSTLGRGSTFTVSLPISA